MKGPHTMKPSRLRWPIILITIMVIWIVILTILIYRGPRLKAWPAPAAPAAPAAAPMVTAPR